jgi:multiple sugar transport system permease protein
MKTRTFLAFVAPSVAMMVALIFLPLIGVVWLAVHNSYVQREMVEVTTEVPLFGGKTRTTTQVQAQPVLDADGNPVTVREFVGARKLAEAAALAQVREIAAEDREGVPLWQAVRDMYGEIRTLSFWAALEFTLIYTLVTTPFVLALGFGLALAVNRVARALKGPLIFVTLLPMIITPIISALSIYWLFLDNAVVSAVLRQMGIGQFYFMQSAFSIRTLIIVYGIWNATPFAFIILYAGLQTVPQDTLEAARIDGASRWQSIRLVVMPHLAPLFALITLIHIMDSYRVFDPILVFGSSVFANSLQYLTWYTLAWEDNPHKAAAYALLTVIGIVVLLVPVLRRTWREQRQAR